MKQTKTLFGKKLHIKIRSADFIISIGYQVTKSSAKNRKSQFSQASLQQYVINVLHFHC